MSWKDNFPEEHRYFETERGILYCGDCLEIMKSFPDESIDLVLTDPPYVNVINERWDKQDVFNDDIIKRLKRLMKKHASLYVWCGIGEKSQTMIDWFLRLKKYFYFKDLITWKKQRGLGNRRGWLYTREEILWFVKDNKHYIWNTEYQYSDEKRGKMIYRFRLKNGEISDKYIKSEYKRLTNVWCDITEPTFDTKSDKKVVGLHKAVKPLKAISRIIKVHTFEGDLILDPFFGSGTTGVAAEQLKRRWIGIEINPEYCEIAKQRILQARKEVRLWENRKE